MNDTTPTTRQDHHITHPACAASTLAADNDSSRWDDYKKQADIVSMVYRRTDHPKVAKWGDRIRQCAKSLAYAYEPADDGTYRRQLVGARLCRVRTCPVCQWRRSLRLTAEVGTAIKAACDRDKLQAVLLTLTVRNCDVADLRSTVQDMLRAWSRMTRRVSMAGVDEWVRSVEVTRGRAYIDDDAHPHIHCILLYKKLPYQALNNDFWAAEWGTILNLDYQPIVDARLIEGDATREVLKYAVKPSADTAVSGWLGRVALALDGVRVFGASKGIKASDELPEDADDNADNVPDLPYVTARPRGRAPCVITYRWDGVTGRYYRNDIAWGITPREYRAWMASLYSQPPH